MVDEHLLLHYLVFYHHLLVLIFQQLQGSLHLLLECLEGLFVFLLLLLCFLEGGQVGDVGNLLFEYVVDVHALEIGVGLQFLV